MALSRIGLDFNAFKNIEPPKINISNSIPCIVCWAN